MAGDQGNEAQAESRVESEKNESFEIPSTESQQFQGEMIHRDHEFARFDHGGGALF
jgi:hypothetical protein